ncbi:D-alanyl-D-alanine carboxypeptidase (penicillin-binding protein 5/6) [Amycolatopsis marina]|uniref:D-alanyl-D-alanine carboxypeptidase (Penicillin-binding protein 5/6) n=1 Tax=Amycolatopsis marina TaxID=490629 RepID=A0A1I1A4Q9_9PSEU|nr:D-alanyl-D-alanine carboxypeptidase family protein [Amycolatopsis marina]SFB32925.1 D-alanyl-D-alanine carboxypeptidase (penicillin-binding protein 5/6) [Amycolatopsis marina]
MRSVCDRSLRVLLVAVLSGVLAVTALPAAAQDETGDPSSQSCSNRRLPPPPVDTSEEPPPGVPSPEPLPVPIEPVGGERMGECGLVLPTGAPAPPEGLTAESWLVQDLDSGAVLAAKNPHGRHRPASLVKILTALVAIQEFEPDDTITPTELDANQECTCVGIVAGEEYTVDDMLHGLLMRSGNDVAHAFATALGGMPVALEKMNDLAARIGARDTRAATTSGLDGPGMMTSAYDMSLVYNYAIHDPEFAKAVATQHIDFPGAPGEPDIPIYNDNRLLDDYPGFLGGKTGFTDDARHTYAGGAERDGRRIAVVLLRGEQRPTRLSAQAAELLDYGFALAATGPEPVGQLNYSADTLAMTEEAEPEQDQVAAAGTSVLPSEKDPFGVTGWIITLIAAIVSIGGVIVVHRRRQAEE